MAWFRNGRKYWKYRGRIYSCRIKRRKTTISSSSSTDPYKRALGMTREQFNYEMNKKYLEKFPTYEAKLKHLGISKN